MKDDRLRVPVEAGYVHALGFATYCFSRLEWDVVWCCEKIAAGSINALAEKTAGNIARQFIKIVSAMPSSNDQIALLAAASDFKALVEIRNGIMHGKPGTDVDGGQRLYRDGTAWTVDSLNVAADRFTECSSRLNAMLYAFLA